MLHSNNEMMRLKSELANALMARDDRDMYKKAAEDMEVSLNCLKIELHQVSSENDANAKEATQVTAELQAQHQVELENLRTTISNGMTESAEVEGVKEAMLKMEVDKKALTDEVEELKESVMKLEGEKEEEMKGHGAEVEGVRAAMLKMEEEKEALEAQVEENAGEQQSLNERVATLIKQLEAETATKKVRQLYCCCYCLLLFVCCFCLLVLFVHISTNFSSPCTGAGREACSQAGGDGCREPCSDEWRGEVGE